ncbi:MAG: AAA family ATPase [Ideonella sp.]|nr:AAA family ATPase [Ideonella sp.]
MWDTLVEALRAQLANQLVAGAVALGLVGVLAASLRRLPGLFWGQLRRGLVVTATLDSRNDLFAAFVVWLNDQRFSQRSRWFTVVQAPPAVAEDGSEADDTPKLQYSPAPGFHLFWFRGRLMWMQREIAMNLQVVETIHLGALFTTRRLMEELLESVARHAGERRANRLTLFTVDRWGDEWRLADSKPRRALDSVVLDEGVAKLLHDDIHEFFSRREWYAQMGIPWRRGYLLFGPPGTGKTSAAFALAGELRLKLCALSLTNPKLTDNVMADLLQRTPPRSLILIEDIDAFFNSREKQDARIQISFSGLLNALDGVGAQEGRIIVLTTNHRERLDAALIRPGRIDLEIELGNATPSQLRGLLQRFYPDANDRIERIVAAYPAGSLSPAQVQQILIAADSLDEAEAALHSAFAAATTPST